jgi:hypothetical protein
MPFEPLAVGKVTWLPASAGGRVTGPPSGPDYRVTTVFADTPEAASGPEHADEHRSIWLRFLTDPSEDEPTHVEIGFLYTEGLPPLVRGTRFMVMEGHRVVAEGVVDEAVLRRHS